MLGMTRGEMGLVLFVFLLVWVAGVVPRIGERIGAMLANRSSGRPADPSEKEKGAGGS